MSHGEKKMNSCTAVRTWLGEDRDSERITIKQGRCDSSGPIVRLVERRNGKSRVQGSSPGTAVDLFYTTKSIKAKVPASFNYDLR